MDMESRGTFGIWDESIHMPEDQQKRIKSAEKADTTPLAVDKDAQNGVFPGSGKKPYETTLDSCTCGDFIRRKLPCKHMYRLAMECGIFKGNVKSGINKNTIAKIQIPFKEVVTALESLNEECQKEVMTLLRLNLYDKCDIFYIQDRYFGDLLISPLFISVESTPDNLLKAYSREDLLSILQEKDIEGYRFNMRIATLIRWCLENIPDLWSVIPLAHAIRFSDQVQKSRHKLYTYLLRKYAWEEIWGENGVFMVPHGAKCEDVTLSISLDGVSISGDSDTYWFPDDEITQLLTEHGHNRCLNGYRPKEY